MEPPNGVSGRIAGANTAVTVSFSGVSGVPEPSTWAMMALGFAGLGFLGFARHAATTLWRKGLSGINCIDERSD